VSSAKQAGADISPVARALVGLIPAISDRETLTMAVALAQVAADSPETARELSESAAERAMAIGIPHESADWLLRNAGRTADLRRAIQDEIRAGDLRESLSLIRPIRRALRYNAGIAGAVAQRLARGDVQCELVIEALEEMANWKDGIGRFREEIDAAIGVAGQCEGSGTAIGLLREVLDS
jgi:hypothetical protein